MRCWPPRTRTPSPGCCWPPWAPTPAYFGRLAEINRNGPGPHHRHPRPPPALPCGRPFPARGGRLAGRRPASGGLRCRAHPRRGIHRAAARSSSPPGWAGWSPPACPGLRARPGPGSRRGRLAGPQGRLRAPGRAAGRRHGRLAGRRWAGTPGPGWSAPIASTAARYWTSGKTARYRAGHIPGAVHIELGDLPGRTQAAPEGAVLMCGHGGAGHDRRQPAAAHRAPRPGRAGRAGPGDWAAAAWRRCRTGRDPARTYRHAPPASAPVRASGWGYEPTSPSSPCSRW